MIDGACASPSYGDYSEGYGPGAADMKRGWAEYLPREPTRATRRLRRSMLST